jgi:hypothetical protein
VKNDPIQWLEERRKALIRDNQRITHELQQDLEQLGLLWTKWTKLAGRVQSIFSFFFKRK